MSAIRHVEGAGSAFFYGLGCRCAECRADRNRETSRLAKRRRRGRCKDCGATTRYNGHGRAVSDLCATCSNRRIGMSKRGQGPVVGKALRFLSEPRHYAELRDHLGVDNNYTSALLYGRLLRFGLVESVSRGVYRRVA